MIGEDLNLTDFKVGRRHLEKPVCIKVSGGSSRRLERAKGYRGSRAPGARDNNQVLGGGTKA
jgi:hypothetical protein